MTTDKARWTTYNDAQAGRAPRPLCREVLYRAGPGAGRQAVDLGSGAGIETKAMLDQGWRVLAIDGDAALPGRMQTLVGADPALETRVVVFQEAEMPAADLVYAGYALPFVHPSAFSSVWQRIRGALRPGGWLAVDLFGDRDSWADNHEMTFLDRPTVDHLLSGLTVEMLDEEDADGRAFSGPKHWHVFHVIARHP